MARANPFQEQKPGPFPKVGTKPVEVVVTRGLTVESRHRVHVAVADAKGKLRSVWGDAAFPVFPRSSIKPLQALPLLLDGHASRFSLGPAELAMASASHHGEDVHVGVVGAWLERIGLSQADLECGSHAPYNKAASAKLIRAGESACPIHNNCSGKHTGMLTACLGSGLPTRGYSDYGHAHQARLRGLLGPVFGVDLEQAPWGVDGCGIPSYALPLSALSRGMAACAGGDFVSSEIQEAMVQVNAAIAARPECIGGTDSLCSRIVSATKGRVFAKLGAEGVYGAWIPEAGLGIAIKCEDGAMRATEVVLAAVLRELGFPLPFSQEAPVLKRWAGESVGQIYCL